MSFIARVKGLFGGANAAVNLSFSGTVTLYPIPDNAAYVYLTGTSTPIISSLGISPSSRGRIIVLENEGATTITLTSTTSGWTAGQMDLGASDISLATDDVVTLFVRKDGVIRRIASVDN